MTQLTDSPAPTGPATGPAPAAVPAPARSANAPATVPANAPAAVPPAEGAYLTGAEALVRSLETVGVDTVFGIPGGAILPAYDPLMDSTRLRHVLVRHEQGAGHAATGYAQATGRVGVCMATSGPG
ncbi:thiamine pyrophosphate-binding protein, partial [Kitasatospora phosalacinea]|uniref:thiamine pyrophosphate-binding protein n=1 Tax=Kitasatospora phosalacinea TaxID=2065 RepID=UPI0035D5C89F